MKVCFEGEDHKADVSLPSFFSSNMLFIKYANEMTIKIEDQGWQN